MTTQSGKHLKWCIYYWVHSYFYFNNLQVAAEALFFVLAQQNMSQWTCCAVSCASPRSLLKAHLCQTWTGCSTYHVHLCPASNWQKSNCLKLQNNKHWGRIRKLWSCSPTFSKPKVNLFKWWEKPFFIYNLHLYLHLTVIKCFYNSLFHWGPDLLYLNKKEVDF